MATKVCSKCELEKCTSMFHKSKHTASGLRPECKDCKKEIDREYRVRNAEKIRERDKKYYEQNAEKIRQRAKDWYDNNLERATEYRRDRFQTNKDQIYEYRKEYNERNHEKIKTYMNTYMQNRYHTNINYKVKSICNKRIRDCVRNKSKKTVEYIGCDIDFLKEWLEYQFVEGMTWDNMGIEWHIDHVRPCSSFDFSNDTDISECYHWTNLQPLFARDNISKSNKVDPSMIANHKILATEYLKSKTYQVS